MAHFKRGRARCIDAGETNADFIGAELQRRREYNTVLPHSSPGINRRHPKRSPGPSGHYTLEINSGYLHSKWYHSRGQVKGFAGFFQESMGRSRPKVDEQITGNGLE